MNRQNPRSQTEKANPDPIDETRKSTAPTIITLGRPQRSARLPANHAPTAEPIRAIATTKPVTPEARSKWLVIESTAPLITEVSKPKRKPPTAAAIEMAVALAGCRSPWSA